MYQLVSFSVELALIPLAKQNAAILKPIQTILPLLFILNIRPDIDSYAVTPVINSKTMHLVVLKLPCVFSYLVF